MKVNTKHFGEITIAKKEILNFVEGLLGFEELTEYIFVERKRSAPFVWLQSTQDVKVCFVTVNPYLFFPEYRVNIQKVDHQQLDIQSVDDVALFSLVVVPQDQPENISVNLLAPVIVNRHTRKAKQIVLDDPAYSTKHFLSHNRLVERRVA